MIAQRSWGEAASRLRRLCLYGLLASLLLVSAALQLAPAAQAASSTTIRLTLDQRRAVVNGQTVTLDTAPILDSSSNRTFVPVRFVAETLGVYIGWDGQEEKITYLTGDSRISLWIGRKEAQVNGRLVELDAAPYIDANNRTLVPVRFVSEQMGASVDFDGAAQAITVTAPWAGRVVVIENYQFNSASLSIEVGTRVTWVNLDNDTHNVYSPDVQSPALEQGDVFTYTFTQAGTFTYVCTYHRGMAGTVDVN